MFPEDDPRPAHQQFPEQNCLTPNRPCRGTFREACHYSNGSCTKGLSPLERVRDWRIPSRPPLDAMFNPALPPCSGSRANRRAIRAVVVGRVTRSAVDFTTDHYKSNHITSLYATASCTTSVLLHTPTVLSVPMLGASPCAHATAAAKATAANTTPETCDQFIGVILSVSTRFST